MPTQPASPSGAPARVDPMAYHKVFHEDWSQGIRPSIWSPAYYFKDDTPAAAHRLDRRGFPGELQLYVDKDFCGVDDQGHALTAPLGLDPFTCDRHGLTIKAWRTPHDMLAKVGGRPFLSGLLQSQPGFCQKYGYFAWRGVLPNDGAGNPLPGAWPAFWHLTNPARLKNDRVEIDVMESIGDGKSYSTTHSPLDKIKARSVVKGIPLHDGKPHVWGVLWTADVLAYYFDHVLIPGSDGPPPAQATEPWTCLVNLAIGGDWPGGAFPALANPPKDSATAALWRPYTDIEVATFRCAELSVYAPPGTK